jgi:hypothetical protein
MASEIHLLGGKVCRIPTKTALIRSLEPVTIAKIRRLHCATIDVGNKIVFESRRHD